MKLTSSKAFMTTVPRVEWRNRELVILRVERYEHSTEFPEILIVRIKTEFNQQYGGICESKIGPSCLAVTVFLKSIVSGIS
jgi:hypothetical protein